MVVNAKHYKQLRDTTVAVGSAKGVQAQRIGADAAQQVLYRLQRKAPSLALVFVSSYYETEGVVRGVRSVLGSVPLIGSSTAGEIGPRGPDNRSVVVVGISLAEFRCHTGLARGISTDARLAGQTMAMQALQNMRNTARNPSDLAQRLALLIFSDGLTGNGAAIMRGIQEVLGTSFPIIGGSSGDQLRFRETHQILGANVITDGVVGALLSGSIAIGVGSRHGWRPLGKPRLVTRASANRVMEIDDRPAVQLYEEYFGEEAATELGITPMANLGTLYPLGTPIPDEEEYLVRNPLRVDESGSLVCGAEISQGSTIRLMMGSRESALAAARRAAFEAKSHLGDATPRCVLVFDSVSRLKLLGREALTEIRHIRSVFDDQVPVAGFYTYGEQAPLIAATHMGKSYFQNETVVVVAIGELS